MVSLHRFFVDVPLFAGEISLPLGIARQLTTVLRMRPGAQIVLFDGRGTEWLATLVTTERTAVTVRVSEQRDPKTEPALRLTLCQALLKGDRMEWVLQKGTELGVAVFQPVITERVVATHRGGWSSDRLDRWRRIVVEAAEQSGRTVVPIIATPVPLRQTLHRGAPVVFCWEEEESLPFREAVWAATKEHSLQDLSVCVGPEGGFSDAEASEARAAGARIASLGKRILRSETAAIAACSLALLDR